MLKNFTYFMSKYYLHGSVQSLFVATFISKFAIRSKIAVMNLVDISVVCS